MYGGYRSMAHTRLQQGMEKYGINHIRWLANGQFMILAPPAFDRTLGAKNIKESCGRGRAVRLRMHYKSAGGGCCV